MLNLLVTVLNFIVTSIKARLLGKKDLIFDKAVNIAVTMELSEKGFEQMKLTAANAT